MDNYALIVLDEKGDMFTIEFEDLDDVFVRVMEADAAVPGWRGMTLCRIEDFPKLMDGMVHDGVDNA